MYIYVYKIYRSKKSSATVVVRTKFKNIKNTRIRETRSARFIPYSVRIINIFSLISEMKSQFSYNIKRFVKFTCLCYRNTYKFYLNHFIMNNVKLIKVITYKFVFEYKNTFYIV